MPDRYHIHTAATPAFFRRIGKFANVDWREDCSRCSNCVKPRCLYDVHRHESAFNRDPLAPGATLDECRACLSCVQGCTKGLLDVSVNPEFLNMGDEYWTPGIILTTWNQADTGRIPVSLPQASGSAVEKHQDRTIEIVASGDIYLDDALVAQDVFESALASLPPDTSFLIRADRTVAFQRFVDVANVLKRLNFSKVAIQTKTVSR